MSDHGGISAPVCSTSLLAIWPNPAARRTNAHSSAQAMTCLMSSICRSLS